MFCGEASHVVAVLLLASPYFIFGMGGFFSSHVLVESDFCTISFHGLSLHYFCDELNCFSHGVSGQFHVDSFRY